MNIICMASKYNLMKKKRKKFIKELRKNLNNNDIRFLLTYKSMIDENEIIKKVDALFD